MGRGQLGFLLGILIALPAAAHDPAPLHVITVSGTGEATARPDRARLALGVESRSLELKKAEDAVNAVVRAYLKDARTLGARDEDLASSASSIYPEYVWEEGKGQRFTGYRVSRSLEVRVTNLDRLGDFLLKATADGVTQVNPPMLESSKADEIARQALAKAADNARAKARVLAEQLGAKLGGVQRIAEQGTALPPMPMVYAARAKSAAMDEAGNDQMGLSLGELRVTASITADFDLLPP